MKQILLCLVTIFVSVIIFGQPGNEGTAMVWTQSLSWKEIQEKAKHENKYIFVDCYATWCKPCKEMDENVYSVDSVGNFFNKEFISVKLQMDQTKADDVNTKKWYKTTTSFTKDYNLNAYPTLLFFTASGEIATKEVGYKDAAALITAARNAKDPSKQYYVLLKKYKSGKLDDAAKRSLIKTAKQLGDTTNYHTLRNSYFAYLHALPKEKLYTKANIEFIASIISRRSHVVFDMFYPDGNTVDKVMEKSGYAKKVVDEVIMKETISGTLNNAMDKNVEPDWNLLNRSIAQKYNEAYAGRNVMEAKILWYWFSQDALNTAKTLNAKMEKYGSDTTSQGEDFKLNNWAYLLWKSIGATEKPSKEVIAELSKISNWMKAVVRRGEHATEYYRTTYWPGYIDTYAQVLHKIGRTEEAISWEQFAIAKLKEFGGSQDNIEAFEEIVGKMRKGEPTWPIEAQR